MGNKSKLANWKDGKKRTKNRKKNGKWEKLKLHKNLSVEFRHQIDRNLSEQ